MPSVTSDKKKYGAPTVYNGERVLQSDAGRRLGMGPIEHC